MLRTRHARHREDISGRKICVHWFVGAVLTGISGLLLATNAVAESKAVEFNIPAQPVPSALRAYARQAAVQLLASTQGLDAIQANAVVGRFDSQTALQMLLAGTGLQAEYRSDATVVVRRTTEASLRSASSMESQAPLNLVAQANGGASQIGPNSDSEEFEKSVKALKETREEIVVVGSHIRGIKNDFAPVLRFDRAELDRTGFGSVIELADSLPQNFGGGGVTQDTAALSIGDGFGNVFTGSAINLRGLGVSSTLTLLNGRRIPAGGLEGQFVDISSIPLSALERVEVLTDGASAIYGSDAIGGVVNFVMRNSYDGAETRLRFGSVTNGDLDEVRLSQAFGTIWDSGNVFLSFEYFNRSNLLTDERPFAGNSDLTSLGGTDNRPSGGNPANILANGQLFAIPAGQDGTSLTAADFSVDALPPNVYNDAAGRDLFPEQERYSLFASLNQAISANAGVFAEGRFSTRKTTLVSDFGAIDLVVPDTNPFFVDPTGTGLTSVTVDNYQLRDDFGIRKGGESTVDSVGGTAGVWLDFAQFWQAEFFTSYFEDSGSALAFNRLNRDALFSAVASNELENAFNPFGDGSNTNADLLESLLVPGPNPGRFSAGSELWSTHLSVDGPIIELPAGAIKLAGGIEYRNEKLVNTTTTGPAQGPFVSTPGLEDRRDILAGYAEVFIPLIGEPNSRTGVSRLELSVAGRHEHYSDIGSSTDPKVGILWSPFAGLNLRGTYGTSFKAPLLRDLQESSLTNIVLWNPFLDNSILVGGGNPNLTPETAATWTAGIDYSPVGVSDFRLSLTYFDIDFENKIGPITEVFTNFDSPEYADLVIEDPTSEEIASFVNSPFFQDFFGASAEDLISGAVPTSRIIDGRVNNVARTSVAGLESQVSYTFETNAGNFSLGFNANYLLNFKDVFLATLPLVEKVDTFQNPVDLRVRSSATWSRGGWNASAFVNFTDSYTNDRVDPEEGINSWTTVDAQVSYSFEERASRWLDGIRLSLSIQNLFDEDPPFVRAISGFQFSFGYDPTNAEPLGRFLAFELTKEW